VKKAPAHARVLRPIGRGGHSEIDFRFAFARVEWIVKLIERGISSFRAGGNISARCAQIEACVPAN